MSNHLKTLLGHFNVNIDWGDEVPTYLAGLSVEDRTTLRGEFGLALRHNKLGAAQFRSATAKSARDENAAQLFFRDVYAYAFEGGEEPYVPDYA